MVLLSVPLAVPVRADGGTAGCLVCHSNSEFGIVQADGEWRSLFVSPKSYAASVHRTQECTACHRNMAEGAHRQPGVTDAEAQAAMKALERVPANDPVAAAACIVCHETEFAEYRDSIHGRTAREGNEDAPGCTDCHGHHYIKDVENLESTVYPSNVPATCAHCHADSTVMAKHDIDRNVYETYDESFHGVRARLGSLRVAVCTSCHGVHDILAPSDPRSKLHPDQRTAACRECHDDASDEFAISFTHRPVTRTTAPLVYWIGTAYTWIIYLTVGAMSGYVLLDMLRWAVSLVRAGPESTVTAGDTASREPVQRWNAHQILQHGLLMLSFTTLVFTGVPLRVPKSAVSQFAIALVGGTDNAGIVHRVAAVVLILTALYHLVYLCAQFLRRNMTTTMLPSLKDVQDVMTMIRYFFGLAPRRARFDRYSFAEKFEYWAVVWGSLIMMATGFVLWLPGMATRLLPAVTLDIVRVVHGYEAILAALAIIIWHFYQVHLHPAAFPMSWTWVTGKMAAEEMRELHPLEYERIVREQDRHESDDGGTEG